VLVSGALEEPPRPSPPTAPAVGACYIVDEGATDAWNGKDRCVAAWTSGGWRFIPPLEGMALFERTSGTWAAFQDGAWELGKLRGSSLLIEGRQVIGPRAAAIESPTGGSVIDVEARAALSLVLDTLRQHGLIEA
jgi:hypothetical protein